MLTGKELFDTLLAELNEMGLPGMSATLDKMFRSPRFVDSGQREYLPSGISGTPCTLDFIDSGLNVCIFGSSESRKSFLVKAIGMPFATTSR